VRLWRVWFVLCGLLVCSSPASAQRATLSGNVVDQSGGVLPGVSITLVNLDRGLKRGTVTDQRGAFAIPLLSPGRYTLTAQLAGFAPYEIKELVLNVGDELVLALRLEVARIGESVTVEPFRASTSPAVGTVVDRQFVENLPLNGRTFQSLIALTPGVTFTKTNSRDPGQFSVNGQRTDTNYFTVDGVSANVGVGISTVGETYSAGNQIGFSAQGSLNNLVSIDALQEFKVQTTSYAPEFGRSPGAQIAIVTRSGTNEFRGSFFDYFRNDVLDANDWFANNRGLKKPELRQNDFGGVLGGPVFRNRTFFFLSYEGLRLRQPRTAITEVPSLDLRQRAAPAIRPLLDAFPVPNGRDFGNGLAEFSASFSNRSSLDATSIRVDHSAGSKLTGFGRFNMAPSAETRRGGPAGGDALNSLHTVAIDTQTMTAGTTIQLSRRVANELRVNYSRIEASSTDEEDRFGRAIPLTDAIFPAGLTSADALAVVNLTIAGFRGIRLGTLANHVQRQVNVIETLAVVAGRHQFKLGMDYRRLFPVLRPLDLTKQVNITGVEEAVTSTVSGFILTWSGARPIFTNLSLFAQDTWSVSPRLTLTYGVRWERNPPPSSADGRLPRTVTNFFDPGAWMLAAEGTPLWRTTGDNIAPRIGGAYQLAQRPGWETMIRAGTGIFYDLGTSQATQGFESYPYFTVKNLTNVQWPLAPDVDVPAAAARPYSVRVFDPNLKLPYTIQWNVSVDQTIGATQTFTVSYVGAAGRRLVRQQLRQLLPVNPDFSSAGILTNGASSDYYGLQLQFQRRLSKGLQTMVSYTLSRSMDDASTDQIDLDLQRAPSAFDVRHVFGAATTYNIPTPPVGVFGRHLLEGWSVDALVRAQSGFPLTLMAGSMFLDGLRLAIRPDVIPGGPFYLDDPTAPGGRRLNPAAFVVPPPGRQGTLGRNAVRGFSFSQVDLAVRRQFRVAGNVRLQLRAEVFNLFNTPNFGDPATDIRSGLFGQATSMFNTGVRGVGAGHGLSPLYQVGGPRSVQLALKVQF
jgi:hypothetical protein